MLSLASSKATREHRNYGKIVKNTKRIKTQAQAEVSVSMGTSMYCYKQRLRTCNDTNMGNMGNVGNMGNMGNVGNVGHVGHVGQGKNKENQYYSSRSTKYGVGSLDKYKLKSQAGLQSYQNKLANYEVHKRQVLRDIGRMQTNQYITKSQTPTKPNSQHFFTTKLRQSLLMFKTQPKQNSIPTPTSSTKHSLSSTLSFPLPSPSLSFPLPSPSLSFPLPSPPPSCPNQHPQSLKFIKQMDKQIRLQNKLRKLKLQITVHNRKQIIDKILLFYKQYNIREIEKMVNVEFEQYQCVALQNCNNKYVGNVEMEGIEVEILSEKLLELYQQCESNWKMEIYRKFDGGFVRKLFQQLNFQYKIELNLKCFTRQFNIYFNKGYHSRELYRIYSRLAPLSKPHFVSILSS